MGNFIYHNKWHGYNHHTVPSDDFPDSAIDPIASAEYPFQGVFYNTIPLSAVNDVYVTFNDSNSIDWFVYSNLVKTYSADWSLWSSVRFTASGFRVSNLWPVNFGTRFYFENWNSGFAGYTYWRGFSARIFSAYDNTQALSGENLWPLSTEGAFPPISGRGWHIALSGITWRTNVSAINTRQKNFGPPALLTPNLDNTLFWDVSTAQTAYLTLTENKTITATKLFNVKKGGKYTMWVSLDFCPLPEMNMYFDYNTYRIQVVKYPRSQSYTSNTEVVRLSANNLTRIDFIYDGRFMLGKATHYKIFLPTTEETYYQGLGNTLQTNPCFVTGINEPEKYISPSNGLITIPFSNTFTELSSTYISGSGVDILYFGQDYVFLTFNMVGAAWQNELDLLENNALTATFDRAFGNLSGGDYRVPLYSDNLFATPSIASAPDIMLSAFPNPPYRFAKFKTNQIPVCLSALEVNIRSGKDRDIKRILINNAVAATTGPLVNGVEQKYNFTNERQAVINFTRIQQNYRIDVFCEKQAPVKGSLRPVIWIDPIDNFTLNTIGNKVESVSSKPNDSYRFFAPSSVNRPFNNITDITRSLYFTTSAGDNTYLTINKSLSTDIKPKNDDGLTNLTTFTVVEPVSVLDGSEWVVWWIGDYRFGVGGSIGYGLVLSGNRICFGGINANNVGLPKFFSVIRTYAIEKDKPFLITTVLESTSESNPKIKRPTVYLNGSRLSLQAGLAQTMSLPLTSYQLNFGTAPNLNKFGNFKLHSFIMYKEALTPSRLSLVNNHLISKFNIPKSS